MNLKKAQNENRLEACLKHYRKYKLLMIDMRYEEKSTIFSTNATVVNIVGDSYRLKDHFRSEESNRVHS